MAVNLLANGTITANPVNNFTHSLNDGLEAASGVISAVTSVNAAASSHNTILGSECEVEAKLVFTSFVECAVYLNLVTINDFSSNHYRLRAFHIDSQFDGVSIIRRVSGVETVLWTTLLVRGKLKSGDRLRLRKYDAGTSSVLQAYVDTNEGYGPVMVGEFEDTAPLQVSGYIGLWLGAGSSGMSLDDVYGGDLTVNWCATTGSDAAAGTFAAPWQTLRFACDKAQLSATAALLIIRGGTYTQRMNDAFGDVDWKTGQDIRNWTSYEGYVGEIVDLSYAGGATVQNVGTGSNGLGGTNFVQFIRWSTTIGATSGFRVSDRSGHIRWQHCEASNCVENGWQIAQYKTGVDGSGDDVARYNQLIDCVMSNNATSGSSGHHGCYDQTSATLVEFSDVLNNNPNTGFGSGGSKGIQHNTVAVPAAGAKQTHGCVYRYNRISNNGQGISISGTDGLQAYGNEVFLNRYGGGIGLGGATDSGPLSPLTAPNGTVIINNSIWATGDSGAYGASNIAPIHLTSNSQNSVVVNNILYGFAGDDRWNGINQSGSPGNTVANNLNGNDVDESTSFPVASDVNPLWVNIAVGAEDFRLTSTSPSRHAVSGPFSDVSSYFLTDLAGTPLNGSTPDQGARQFLTPESATPPINVYEASGYEIIAGMAGTLAGVSVVDNNTPEALASVELYIDIGGTLDVSVAGGAIVT